MYRILILLMLVMIIFTNCKKKKYNGDPLPKGWSRLGGSFGLSYTNDAVWSIAVDKSDNVYIAEDYDPSGKWAPLKYNGSAWSKVGNLNCTDLFEHWKIGIDGANNIYLSLGEAGAIANSTNLAFIAKYDGNWKMVGQDINSNVSGVSSGIPFCVTSSGNIYASFLLPTAGSAYRNVKWNGSAWVTIPLQYTDASNGQTVTADMSYGCYADASGNVYTGGVMANGTRVISKYNGTSWQNIGFPFTANASVRIVNAVFDGNGFLYIIAATNGGSYTIGKWNGSNWATLGTLPLGEVATITVASNNHVYAAGGLKNAAGKYYVADWNGTSWSELGGVNTSVFNDVIHAIAVDSKGYLYVGGEFTNSTGEAYVAVYKP